MSEKTKRPQENFIQEYLYIEDYIPTHIGKEKNPDEESSVIELDIFGSNDEKDNIFI